MLLKKYLPRSLFWRSVMILVLPVLLLQAVVATIFVQRHYDGVTGQMAETVAREINYAVSQVESAPDIETARDRLAQIAAPLGIEFILDETMSVSPEAFRNFYDVTGGTIEETLKSLVRNPLSLDLIEFDKQVDARIQTAKGVLQALIPRRRLNAANPHLLLVWTGVASVLLVAVSLLFLRNQVRPIRELAAAAAAFGRGRAPEFRPHGADEVRRAGAAFLDMRARIERQMESRTRMLSGVSHDLRTPLTRMKLALAVADDTPEMRELTEDVREMEHMLDAFLAFARGDGAEETEPVDPAELAEDLARGARRKGAEVTVDIQVDTPDAPEVELRRNAIRRCLTNLLDNAAAYAGRAVIGVRLGRRFVEFTVEDDGPGIPADRRDDVLRPFTRLDEARSQSVASGVGLGLTIAADIARSHGGGLTLGVSERLGGLKVTVMVPR